MPTPPGGDPSQPHDGGMGSHMITNAFHFLKVGKNLGIIGLYEGVMLYYVIMNWNSGIAAGLTAGNLFFAATGIQLLFYSDYKLWETMAFINMVIAGSAWTYPSYILGPLAVLGMIICHHTDVHEWVIMNLIAHLTGTRDGPFFSLMFELIPWTMMIASSLVMAASYGYGLYLMLTTATTYSQLSTNWIAWVFTVLGAFNVIIDTASLAFPAAVHLARYL